MEKTTQAYQAPELKEWGAVADITQAGICKIECVNGSVYEFEGTA